MRRAKSSQPEDDFPKPLHQKSLLKLKNFQRAFSKCTALEDEM